MNILANLKGSMSYVGLLLAPLLFVSSAFGCSYLWHPRPPVSYIAAKSGKIYIGRVVSTQSEVETRDKNKFQVTKVTLKVEKALKGVDGEIQELTVARLLTNRTSCTTDPPEFKKGERWLIHRDFAEGDGVGSRLGGGVFFSPFIRDPENDSEYVEELEEAINRPLTTISGQVMEQEGVEVVIEGNNLKQSTRTNKTGHFSFKDIPPGRYRVQIRLDYSGTGYYEEQRTTYDAELNLHVWSYEVSVEYGDVKYRFIAIRRPRE